MNRRRFHKDERGSAAAEFALMLPLMVAVLFAFYEAGRMYWGYNTVQASARDAARYAARLAITCSGSSGSFDDGTAETSIKNLTRTSTLDGTGDPLMPGWTDNSSVTVAVTCLSKTISGTTFSGRYEGQTAIPTVTVTAAAPYSFMFGSLLKVANVTAITVSNAQAWTA